MDLGLAARWGVVVLAAHALTSSAAALVVALATRRLSARATEWPAEQARRLFLLGLAPTLTAIAVAWVGVSLSFALWEPRVETERVGPLALAAAGAGTMFVISGAWRVLTALWQTHRVHASLRPATRSSLTTPRLPVFTIDTTTPIVALLGLLQPRLFVARAVLATCTADEFRAIVAHETAHARRRDNLRRLALIAAPDVLAWLPAGARLRRAWAEATELAADEAAGRSAADRLHLASALVKVARLATRPAATLPASAFHGDEPIAGRVRRLVDTSHDAAPPPSPAWPPRAAAAALGATGLLVAPAAHAAIEFLLRLG